MRADARSIAIFYVCQSSERETIDTKEVELKFSLIFFKQNALIHMNRDSSGWYAGLWVIRPVTDFLFFLCFLK